MAKYIDSRGIAEAGQVPAFSDANGIIVEPEQQQNLNLGILKNSLSLVRQAK
ncbi:hypothetical protein [Agarivorans gilvus]|uniref:Uncharacterized protein n=1 Tax=Agarivorans gilvus TaxID=680279 RepID=A0ABQ1I4X1_9ALTE|nr:hypothetical protein [Agarivorans gilvus]GGB15501.1 hypothetical protein GCM10007414_31180 [Agarivorans gilvus]